MQLNIDGISNTIQQFFGDQVKGIARKTDFVQRRSKMTGLTFLTAIVFCVLENRKMSLSDLSSSCLDVGIKITEQGLDGRFNAGSMAFLQEMWELAQEHFRLDEQLDIKLLNQFTHVYLLDSTQISVPANMGDLFPGSGGSASTASIKVQLLFDYLTGQFEQVELTHGRAPDQGYRGHWDTIKEDALYIMDLGYYVLDTFRAISTQGAYFLSRFQAQTAIMDQEGERIVLADMLADQSKPVAEYDVRIGRRSSHRIPCRMIAIRLSQEAADRRRQKAKNNARRRGKAISKKWLKLMDWALFITNVPSTMLHMEHVATIYRIRWQIELVFKMCKSFCGLDYVASLRPERVMTEFYARLIGVVITYFLVAPARLPFGALVDREISPFKVRKTLKRFARSLHLVLQAPFLLAQEVRSFYRHVGFLGFKQKRRKSPNSTRMVALISTLYEWDSDDLDSHSELDISLA